MTVIRCLRTQASWLLAAILVFGLAACGGGGSKSSGGDTGPTAILRTATPTRTRTLRPGEATFTSTVPPPTETPTPTETPIPTSTPIVAGSSLLDAIRQAAPGSMVLIPPGIYEPFTLQASDVQGAITLMADRSDVRVGSSGAVVTVNANGASAAITLQGITNITIDGFSLTGSTLAAIRMTDCVNVIIRNSVFRQNSHDGIEFIRSSSGLIFNNLVFDNGAAGIDIVGGNDVSVINNTIYGSTNSGLLVGDATLPSTATFVRNNIFEGNGNGINVNSTTTGFDSDFNLNRDGYSSDDLRGAHDINADPQFNDPGTEDGFHLPPTDDNCDGGSPATDSADPSIDPGLLAILSGLTTQTDQRFDCLGDLCCPLGCNGTSIPCTKEGLPDMGFHYLSTIALAPPTPTRRPTKTPGPAFTATPVPTV